MTNRYFFFLIIILFFATSLQAQNFGERASIGIYGGIMQYHGSMPETEKKFAAGINLHYEITDKIALRFQYTASEAGGGDSSLNNIANNGNDIRSQHYYFNTNINEFNLLAEYNFFNINAGAKFTPYIFSGIGYYNFKPYQTELVTRANGTVRYQNVAMKQVEKFSNWKTNIPAGIGIKYAFSPNFMINAEGSYRFLFNKYIDNYIADNKKDSYYTITLGIIFRLSKISVKSSYGNGGSSKNCKCPPVY
ncbi:MAG: DUF6089 family protein [Arachidicoccus sp.]|nr:DUF6089 family protein [Arachidicoccus sp.]